MLPSAKSGSSNNIRCQAEGIYVGDVIPLTLPTFSHCTPTGRCVRHGLALCCPLDSLLCIHLSSPQIAQTTSTLQRSSVATWTYPTPGPRESAGCPEDVPLERLPAAKPTIRYVGRCQLQRNFYNRNIVAGKIISLQAMGRCMVIIDDANTAVELLEKRSAIYSSRAHSVIVDL